MFLQYLKINKTAIYISKTTCKLLRQDFNLQ